MKQDFIKKVNQIKVYLDNLNVIPTLKSGRELAFNYLNWREFSQDDFDLIKRYNLIEKLDEHYQQIQGNKEVITNKHDDYLNMACKKQCNFNFLGFDEVGDSTLYDKYIFGDISETTDFAVLLNLAILQSGAILYMSDIKQKEDYMFLTEIEELPPGFLTVIIVDDQVQTGMVYNSVNSTKWSLKGIRVFVGEEADFSLINLHSHIYAESLLSQQIIMAKEAKADVTTFLLGGQGRLLEGIKVIAPRVEITTNIIYCANSDDYFEINRCVKQYGDSATINDLIKGVSYDKAKVDCYHQSYIDEGIAETDYKLNHQGYYWGGEIKKFFEENSDFLNNKGVEVNEELVNLDEKIAAQLQATGKSDQEIKAQIITDNILNDTRLDLPEDVRQMVLNIIVKKL